MRSLYIAEAVSIHAPPATTCQVLGLQTPFHRTVEFLRGAAAGDWSPSGYSELQHHHSSLVSGKPGSLLLLHKSLAQCSLHNGTADSLALPALALRALAGTTRSLIPTREQFENATGKTELILPWKVRSQLFQKRPLWARSQRVGQIYSGRQEPHRSKGKETRGWFQEMHLNFC